MRVPFGKILRGKVVPNTVTKTLHTDKVYEPDLDSYSIEPFPYYSPLKSQIATIRSFDRPVILVDDLVHKADRLQALAPSLAGEEGGGTPALHQYDPALRDAHVRGQQPGGAV